MSFEVCTRKARTAGDTQKFRRANLHCNGQTIRFAPPAKIGKLQFMKMCLFSLPARQIWHVHRQRRSLLLNVVVYILLVYSHIWLLLVSARKCQIESELLRNSMNMTYNILHMRLYAHIYTQSGMEVLHTTTNNIFWWIMRKHINIFSCLQYTYLS